MRKFRLIFLVGIFVSFWLCKQLRWFDPAFCGSDVVLVSGTANQPLAKEIAERLGKPLITHHIGRFSDDEVRVEIPFDLRGKKIVVVQSMAPQVNNMLMETLVIVDALRRLGVLQITLCTPYLAYARQDRQMQEGTPISARLTAKLLEKAGVNQLVVCDLHADQIQGFFDVPVHALYSTRVCAEDIQERFQKKKNIVIVSPDVGGLRRAGYLAKALGVGLTVINKKRDKPGESGVIQVIGPVKGKICVLFDDLVDSGGTLMNAAKALFQEGAQEVHAYCTHGVLSNNAARRIQDSKIQTFTLANSILHNDLPKKFRRLSLAPLLTEGIEKAVG